MVLERTLWFTTRRLNQICCEQTSRREPQSVVAPGRASMFVTLISWTRRLVGNKGLYSLIGASEQLVCCFILISSSYQAQDEIDINGYPESSAEDGDRAFGGHQARKDLEKRVLRKIDIRMSMLVLIYILCYVRHNDYPCVVLS